MLQLGSLRGSVESWTYSTSWLDQSTKLQRAQRQRRQRRRHDQQPRGGATRLLTRLRGCSHGYLVFVFPLL